MKVKTSFLSIISCPIGLQKRREQFLERDPPLLSLTQRLELLLYLAVKLATMVSFRPTTNVLLAVLAVGPVLPHLLAPLALHQISNFLVVNVRALLTKLTLEEQIVSHAQVLLIGVLLSKTVSPVLKVVQSVQAS